MPSRSLFAFLAIIALAAIPRPAPAQTVLVEAESFAEPGGWSLDTQFIHIMGSPYLLAHGLGEPVKDATTTVKFPATGTYKVFVRTSTRFPSAGKVFTSTSILTGLKEETWTQSSRTLRVDFATPVTTVSLRALYGGDTGETSFGRLDAYDAAGNLVGRYTTSGLTANKSELMTILRPTAEISYVVAHAHMQSKVLFDSLNAFAYSNTAAIVVVIIVAVSLIDMLSQAIRSRLL